jgi:hypothetical protein
MNVRLPDGTVVKNVPDNISKADLILKLEANGYDVGFLKEASKPKFKPVKTGTSIDQIPIDGYSPAPAAVTTPTLSTGQKVYKNIIRPVLAPTVETVGAVGGGMLGTAGGPAGIVGGTGLGYGLAKEGLENVDVALGIKPPRQGANILVDPLTNVVEGATYEAGTRGLFPYVAPFVQRVTEAGRGLLSPISKMITESDLAKKLPFNLSGVDEVQGLVKPQPTNAQVKAAKIASQALGTDLPDVLSKLKNAPQNASVAEITASFNNPTWQALIQDALERDPQFLRKIKLFGDDESLKVLSKLAGGENAAEVRAIAENAKKALNVTTTPQREAALNRANLGKYVAEYEATAGKLSKEAANEVQEVRRLIGLGDNAAAAARLESIKAGFPASSAKAPAKSQAGFSDEWVQTYTYPGKLAKMSDEWASNAANASLDLGQGARFSQAAADSLKAVGIKPLKTDSLISSIRGITNNPKFAGNKDLLNSVDAVADDIARWTDGNGVIDVQALEAIRKHSVNGVIQRLYPSADATQQKRLASDVLSSIKPLIDDAIEATGGTGWKKYLSEYSKGMQKIAERKLTGEALRLYKKKDQTKFFDLVLNESPETVEKVLGVGKYDIAKEVADSTLAVLREQANKRMTQLSVEKQVSEGQKAIALLVQQNTSIMRFPSFLNFFATAGNKALSEYEKALGVNTMKALTEAMKSPQGVQNLLEALPTSEKNRVTELLLNPNTIRSLGPSSSSE